MRRRFRVFMVVALLLGTLVVGSSSGAPPADAAMCGMVTCFGPGDAAYDAYYAAPTNQSTWGPYCAGGGGTVVISRLGVPGCGPTGSTNIRLPGNVYSPGFQCVELVGRYLKVKKNWSTPAANGAGMTRAYGTQQSITPIANGTPNQAPVVGDIISFSGNANFNDIGHVAIVSASTVNGSGNGTITFFNENINSTSGTSNVTMTNWVLPTTFTYPFMEWLHTNLTPPSEPTGVTAFPGHEGGVMVQWTAPSAAGSQPITSYVVTANPSGTTVSALATSRSAWLTGPAVGVSQNFSVRAVSSVGDGSESSTAASTPANSGLLRVTTNPALPSQISVDGTPMDSWGLSWVKVSTGSHQVCFSHVEGYSEPACQNVNVNTNATTTLQGNFTQRGSLHVTTSPAVASTISVDGVPRNTWGMWTDIAPGAHQVCFGLVAGYTPPSCQNINVTAGQTTNVTGTFVASAGLAQSSRGFLRMTTSPALPAQILINGVIADSWGLTWLELPAGSYTITGTHIEGYTDPTPVVVNITNGVTTVALLNYTQRGTLRVQTSPASAGTIYVDGIPRDDYGMWTDIPTGAHTVCYGRVTGLTYPQCQSVTVNAGVLTNTTGTYI